MNKNLDILKNIVNNTVKLEYEYAEENELPKLIHSPEYDEKLHRICEIEETILSKMPADFIDLFHELDNLTSLTNAMESEYMFKMGLISAFTSLGCLNDASNLIAK